MTDYKTKFDEAFENYVPEGSKSAEQIEEERLAEEARIEEENRLAQEAEEERLRLEAEANKTDEEKAAEEAARLEEEANQNKSFSELLKGEKLEEKKEVEIPKEFLEELESYKSKLSVYESDPLVKAVTAGATKEQLVAIAAELNGKDYSKSSYKDLLEAEIRAEGFEGEELTQQLESEMENFESLLPYQRTKLEREMRDKFQSASKKGESPTLDALENAYKEKLGTIKTPEQMKQEVQQVALQEVTAIKTLGSKLVGQKLYGVEFTQEELNHIVEKEYDVNKVSDYVNDQGELEVGKFLESKFIAKNLAKMIELAEERGVKRVHKETASVGAGSARKVAPIVHDKKSSKQEVAAGLLPDYIVKNLK